MQTFDLLHNPQKLSWHHTLSVPHHMYLAADWYPADYSELLPDGTQSEETGSQILPDQNPDNHQEND